jgi:Icc protein
MRNNSPCLTILQLSDLHILQAPDDTLLGINTEHYFHTCLEQAVLLRSGQAVNLILLTGDLAQDPCRSSYNRILDTLKTYKIPCICLPGNHDDFELMQQVFNTDKINCCKQVLMNNWQLISLNSQVPGEPGGRVSNEELAFLESGLSAYPYRHALVAVHHHCLPTLSPWMDTMIIENSPELLAVLEKYPQVKVITTGHIHQVMDMTLRNIRVLGAPSTCFQFVPESPEFSVDDTAPGYRVIDLYADGRVESEVIRLPEPLQGLKMNRDGY